MPGKAWSRTSPSRKVVVSWTKRDGCANLAEMNRGPSPWCSRANALWSSALGLACESTGCPKGLTIVGHAACFHARTLALTSSHVAMTRARDGTAHGVTQRDGRGRRKLTQIFRQQSERPGKSSSACLRPCKLNSDPRRRGPAVRHALGLPIKCLPPSPMKPLGLRERTLERSSHDDVYELQLTEANLPNKKCPS